MKKQYVTVEIEILNVKSTDIIATSSPFDSEEQPLFSYPGMPSLL